MSPTNFIDITGNRYGLLTVMHRAPSHPRRYEAMWECLCDCGNKTVVTSSNLRYGVTKSCGCLAKGNSKKHGQYKTRLYRTWSNMKSRCHIPTATNYSYYGGRGITVCDEWRYDFAAFRSWALSNGYADNLTIDRIDNDKGYYPDNCRWVPFDEQNRNKRPRRKRPST